MSIIYFDPMPAPVPNEDMPEVKRLLQPLVGRWKGRFKVFEPDGTLIRRLEVRQEYFWAGEDFVWRLS